MLQVLKRAWSHTGSLKHYKLLQQLFFYMIFIDFCLIASVACVISYTFVIAGYREKKIFLTIFLERNRGGYLIVHTLFRSLEFGLVFGTLVFLRRKKTDTASSSEDKSIEQGTSTVYSINSYNK